jgi:hypothetical protein
MTPVIGSASFRNILRFRGGAVSFFDVADASRPFQFWIIFPVDRGKREPGKFRTPGFPLSRE